MFFSSLILEVLYNNYSVFIARFEKYRFTRIINRGCKGYVV